MFTTISNRVNTLLLVLLVLMAGTIIAILATRASGGPLDPPGPPASTQSNLIYQPTDCSGFPITLSSSGSYALAQDITMPAACAKDGIHIAADDVTLDLRGFTVQGVAAALTGIRVFSTRSNVAIINGNIVDWPAGGVDATNAYYSQFAHLQLTLNGPVATYLGQMTLGWNDALSDCIASSSSTGALGVVVPGNNSVVSNCIVNNNDLQGLRVEGIGNRIINNHVMANNGDPGGCADIWIDGPANFVQDNTAGFGNHDTCPYFIGTGATGSILHRNVAHGGGGFNFDNLCGACDIGPVGTSAAATSPWANISD
jgi:hypothetical protein